MPWGSKIPHKKKSALAACMALCLPLTAHYEGLRTKAYLDVAVPGLYTVCFGETLNVKKDDTHTVEECKEMLSMRLGYFAYQVDKLVTVDITPEEHASYASFAYNVGLKAFEKSTLLKKLNANQHIAACNELTRWNKAGGRVLPGLVKRREAERTLCLSGL